MTPDYYATLGLAPTSEDVVIRAAYLALMRRYHPDANPSAAAAARTRAINAAYAVLSDADRRADYDGLRAGQAAGYVPAARPRARPTGLFAAAAIVLLLVLLPLAIWSPAPVRSSPDRLPEQHRRGADRGPLPSPVPAQAPQPVAEPAPPDPPPLALAHPRPAPAPRLAAALPPPRPRARAAVPSLPARPSPSLTAAANLANLDRQQALLFGQSWSRADEPKRMQLLSSRDRFIARRDACRSQACASGAYLARMREVSEIMMGQFQPPQ